MGGAFGISEILNRSDEIRSQMQVDIRRSEKCSGCLNPLMDGLNSLNQSILARRVTSAVRQIDQLPNHNFRQGAKCEECSGMLRIQLTGISKMASSLEKDLLAGTINIVEVNK